MTPVVAYLIAVGVGLILGVVVIEVGEAKEKQRRSREWAEYDALMSARDVTGHVDPRRW